MKRLFLLFLIAASSLSASSLSAFSLSYNEAQKRAWFLADKMAYELNLSEEQYDRVYQINLDYLLSVNRASDCFGPYWNFRNADLRFVLQDWQYALYSSIDYFFRPLLWKHAAWHYPVLSHYKKNLYYFHRPDIYITYKGRPWTHRHRHDVSPYRPVPLHKGIGMRNKHYRHDKYNKPAPPPSHNPGYKPHPNNRPNNHPGISNRPANRPNDRPNVGNKPNNRPNNRPNVGDRPNERPNVGNKPNNRPNDRPNADRLNRRSGSYNAQPNNRSSNNKSAKAPSSRPSTQRQAGR